MTQWRVCAYLTHESILAARHIVGAMMFEVNERWIGQ